MKNIESRLNRDEYQPQKTLEEADFEFQFEANVTPENIESKLEGLAKRNKEIVKQVGHIPKKGTELYNERKTNIRTMDELRKLKERREKEIGNYNIEEGDFSPGYHPVSDYEGVA